MPIANHRIDQPTTPPTSWSAVKPSDEAIKKAARPLSGKYATQIEPTKEQKPSILAKIIRSPLTLGKKIFSRKTTNKMNDAVTDFLVRTKILTGKKESRVIPGKHRQYYVAPPKLQAPQGLTPKQQEEYIQKFQTIQNEIRAVLKKQMPNASDELIDKKLAKFDIHIDVVNKQVEVTEKVRLLAMDGGGIRGVAVAKILSAMEHSIGEPIHQAFDTVVGTSTGGLLAMMMSVPKEDGKIMSADEAIKVYEDHAKDIFSKSRKKNFLGMKYRGVFTEKYKSKGLRETIAKTMGTHNRIKNAVIPMGVVTNDKANNTPILLNSKEAQNYKGSRSDQTAVKIARATTSAPTFFKGTRIKVANNKYLSQKDATGSKIDKLSKRRSIRPGQVVDAKKFNKPQYVRQSIQVEDGGTVANNPTSQGLKLMREIQGEKKAQFLKDLKKDKSFKGWDIQYESKEKVISIGTGSITGTTENPNVLSGERAGLLQLGKRILADRADLFGMEQSSYKGHDEMMQEFHGDDPRGPYHRIQFKIDKHQLQNMDDDSRTNIESLKKSAGNYIESEDFLYTMAGLLSHMEPGNGHAVSSTSKEGTTVQKTDVDIDPID